MKIIIKAKLYHRPGTDLPNIQIPKTSTDLQHKCGEEIIRLFLRGIFILLSFEHKIFFLKKKKDKNENENNKRAAVQSVVPRSQQQVGD